MKVFLVCARRDEVFELEDLVVYAFPSATFDCRVRDFAQLFAGLFGFVLG